MTEESEIPWALACKLLINYACQVICLSICLFIVFFSSRSFVLSPLSIPFKMWSRVKNDRYLPPPKVCGPHSSSKLKLPSGSSTLREIVLREGVDPAALLPASLETSANFHTRKYTRLESVYPLYLQLAAYYEDPQVQAEWYVHQLPVHLRDFTLPRGARVATGERWQDVIRPFYRSFEKWEERYWEWQPSSSQLARLREEQFHSSPDQHFPLVIQHGERLFHDLHHAVQGSTAQFARLDDLITSPDDKSIYLTSPGHALRSRTWGPWVVGLELQASEEILPWAWWLGRLIGEFMDQANCSLPCA